MENPPPPSRAFDGPPPVLDYARPQPARIRPPGRTPRFTILFGLLISSVLVLAAVLLLIVAAMLCWSSVEVPASGGNSSMQLGGCYALLAGVILLIVGVAGQRMALRQWRSA